MPLMLCLRLPSLAKSVLTMPLENAGAYRYRPASIALLLLCICLTAATATADDWSRFRGPQGAGTATAPKLPSTFGPADYAWKTAIPGLGHSSPVVRGEQVFLTSGSEDGAARQLFCLDAATGRILWSRQLALETDHLHAKNSYASASPVVGPDGVYVLFADDNRVVAAAFALDGRPSWTRDLGPFASQHGQGASPILHDNMLIVPNDQDGPSTIVALDIATGRTLWTTPREVGKTSYSTPFVLTRAGHPAELIASSDGMGVTSLDPKTGTLNWASGALPQRTVGSPVWGNGLIYQTCGEGGRGTLLVGVNPDAATAAARIPLRAARQLPYVPTPLVADGLLFLWGDNGVINCTDLETGEPVWIERVGGNFSGSPVNVDGRIYAISETGEVVVVQAARTFQLLGRSPLGENSYGTPAVAGGRMYLRTFGHLICIGPKTI